MFRDTLDALETGRTTARREALDATTARFYLALLQVGLGPYEFRLHDMALAAMTGWVRQCSAASLGSLGVPEAVKLFLDGYRALVQLPLQASETRWAHASLIKRTSEVLTAEYETPDVTFLGDFMTQSKHLN